MVLLCPHPAAAQVAAHDAVQEVVACMSRNLPKKSSQQTVHFTTVDRIGGQREFRGKLLAIRGSDGARRAKLCVNKPPEMRGSEILSVENVSSSPETFVYTIELRKPTRITSETAGGSVFGTNFSYEDFQRWQLLNRPGTMERLPDSEIDGRPVFVLQTKPGASAETEYSKVLSYIDKKTCVVLKSESFETGDRLRKVLTARPGQMLEKGGIFAPSEIVIKDVRGETTTTVEVEDLDVDGALDERSFEVSSLGRHCR
jgi:hypothetical protein